MSTAAERARVPGHRSARRQVSRTRLRVRRAAAGVLAAAVTWLGISVGGALLANNNSSVVAKLAEWGRSNHLGFAVTTLERIQYDLFPPRTGGRPKLPTSLAAGTAGTVGAAPTPGNQPSVRATTPHTPAPANIPPIVSPALPGEGVWHTVITVAGLPAIRVAFLRPDPVHTSYLTGVAWMDPKLLTFQLHPGTTDPGGSGWPTQPDIPANAYRGLVAAFNAGFRFNASNGGWYLGGRTAQPLRDGAASFVIYRNGTATVGTWGVNVGMTPQVEAVRQNLDPLVIDGRPAPNINNNSSPQWGYTLGNAYYVWRSGIGVTRTGALVYAAGNALTTTSLANVLIHAGAVRAMELDINPYWTNFFYYTDSAPGQPVGHKLTADEQRVPSRYFSPTSRDFFTVYAR